MKSLGDQSVDVRLSRADLRGLVEMCDCIRNQSATSLQHLIGDYDVTRVRAASIIGYAMFLQMWEKLQLKHEPFTVAQESDDDR